MKHRQVTGPKSSFVCATASALALFAAYESIFSSSLSRPTKAITASMNMGNQAIGALFTGSYAFGLLDLLLLCFSGNCALCLSVWLAFFYDCTLNAPSGCCFSSGNFFWFFVVASLCLEHWVFDAHSYWLGVLFCLISLHSEVEGACCFFVVSFASSFHISCLPISQRQCSCALQVTVYVAETSMSYPIHECSPSPTVFLVGQLLE